MCRKQVVKAISIHALLAESDFCQCKKRVGSCISIHALLAESDGQYAIVHGASGQFLSTLSLRRATGRFYCFSPTSFNFYPRSPCGERQTAAQGVLQRLEFLSTLSLRRATTALRRAPTWQANFYPRSPCGERPHANRYYVGLHLISIHALLAESDAGHTF